MKISGLIGIVAAFGVVSSATASFELVLAAGTANGSSEIRRYDDNTGAYLGSFGQGHFSLADQMAIDSTKGLVYVADQNRQTISTFKYSTGEFVNEFNLNAAPTCIVLNSQGNLVVGLFGVARIFNPSGDFLGQVTTGSSDTYVLAMDSLGQLHSFNTTGEYRRYNSSLSLVTSGTVTAASSYYGNGYVKDGLLHASRYGSGRMDRFNVSGSGISLNTSFATGQTVSPLGLAQGHGSRYFQMGSDPLNGTDAVIVRGTTNAAPASKLVTINNFIPRGLATVVAPEPGTMLALGAGILALARRRTNKKQ